MSNVVRMDEFKRRKRMEELDQLQAEAVKVIDEAVATQIELWRKMNWGMPPMAMLHVWFDP